MSDNELLFQRASDLYEENNYNESLTVIESLLKSDPQNDEYKLLYCKLLNKTGDSQKAHREVTRIIEQNPQNTKAVGFRIGLDYDLKEWRMYITDNLNYWHLLDEMNYYDEDPDNEFQARLIKAINNHLRTIIYTRIKLANENIIDYWKCAFIWDYKIVSRIFRGYSFSDKVGLMGVGYVCFTDKFLRLINLKELSIEFYSQYKKETKRGLLATILIPSLEDSKYECANNDRILEIPNATLKSAKITGDGLLVTSLNSENVIIAPEEVYEILTTGIEMSITNDLAKILKKGESKEEIINILKELGELKIKGIISEEEFEMKKRELLLKI